MVGPLRGFGALAIWCQLDPREGVARCVLESIGWARCGLYHQLQDQSGMLPFTLWPPRLGMVPWFGVPWHCF